MRARVSDRRGRCTHLAATTKSGAAAQGYSAGVTDGQREKVTWAPLLAIAASAFAVEVPFFYLGIPSGHDVEFHLYSWLEVLSQWTQGIVYPHWAALAHFGYGEPRFVFYPPASWTLGAMLAEIFPWTLVSSLYIWVALVAAGVSMFFLAREWFDRRDATFAAVLYAVNPYHLLIVYWRSAFAELLTSWLLPLLLLLILRADEKMRKVIILLALLLACAWLTNAPSAVMVHYSLVLLLLIIAWQRHSPRVLMTGGIAVLVGAALAAFYLLPAIYEQRWINITQAISSGYRPIDNFLFVHTSDAEHDAFNRVTSWVAVAEIAVIVVMAWIARSWRTRSRELWYALVIWAAACVVLMLPISSPVWSVLPKLRFMQFPWRWLLCLGVPLTLLTTMAVRRWTLRVALYLAMLAVVAFGWQHYQAPWWDNAGDLREMQDNMATDLGYEGTDEYTPTAADPSAVDKDARRVTVEGPAHAAIHVFEWNAKQKLFTADLSAQDNLVLKLFNYPAWRVEVNGQVVQAGTRENAGQMLVPVQAGENRVQVSFNRTWDRTVGLWISVLALSLILILLRAPFLSWLAIDWRPIPEISQNTMPRILIATSNPGKLRDFSGAAKHHGIGIAGIPNFSSLPTVAEDGMTFEANARKKAEAYSRYTPGEIVLADDSGLEIDALHGAPGVHSARYAAPDLYGKEPHLADTNTDDEANNARVLRELQGVPRPERIGRFVCVLAAARDGKTLATFRGTADGIILEAPRGENGFGYDPLFYFPQIQKTFGELTAEEKAKYSHRGAAFRQFLQWYEGSGKQER